ncbi:MAG: hypothetical protein ACUVRQ_08270, partial [Thermoanaerobaculaceae bacterium]
KGARLWTCSLSKPVLPVQPGFSLANTVFSWCLRPELGYWHPVHRSHLAGPVGQEGGKAMTGDALLRVMTVLAAAPLLLAIITKVKALFAGRRGAPLLQNSDLGKLLRKGAAYSTTTTGIFPVGPVVSLAAIVLAFTIVPMAEKKHCLPSLRFSPPDLQARSRPLEHNFGRTGHRVELSGDGCQSRGDVFSTGRARSPRGPGGRSAFPNSWRVPPCSHCWPSCCCPWF